VLASTELTHGELEAVREDEMWDLSTFDTRATSMRYEVHLGIRTYVVASGPTYASAWQQRWVDGTQTNQTRRRQRSTTARR
jgi:lysozyme family protein